MKVIAKRDFHANGIHCEPGTVLSSEMVEKISSVLSELLGEDCIAVQETPVSVASTQRTEGMDASLASPLPNKKGKKKV
jgi:hypothetical protein